MGTVHWRGGANLWHTIGWTGPTERQMTQTASLTLSGLGHRCRRESDRFFRGEAHDPAYCLEIFRRALVERDETAWALVFEIYTPLIRSWVRRHRGFAHCGEEDQFFVNRALEAMWRGISGEKFDRQARLPALLTYLRLCVHTAVVTYLRRQGPATLDDVDDLFLPDPSPGPEPVVTDDLIAQDLWDLVKGKLKGEKERRFIFAYFTLDMKPREISAEYPEVFADVREVYRIRENVMDRLRRDKDLQDFWERIS